MHPKFERTLQTFSELAKDKRKRSEKTDEELAQLEGAVAWHLSQSAERRGTPIGVQDKIFKLQEKKQKIMAELKRQLALASAGKESGKAGTRVEQRAGAYYAAGKKLSEGELLTDGEWDVRYDLDPKSVASHTRKKYFLEDAKRKLQDLLNQQILEDESSSPFTHEMKRNTYKRIMQEKGSEGAGGGLVAEKMVRSFLRKLSIDYDIDFEIVPADVYQDVENKIDFIVKRKSRVRGVRVEEQEPKSKVGIQFTISESPVKLDMKRRQKKKSL